MFFAFLLSFLIYVKNFWFSCVCRLNFSRLPIVKKMQTTHFHFNFCVNFRHLKSLSDVVSASINSQCECSPLRLSADNNLSCSLVSGQLVKMMIWGHSAVGIAESHFSRSFALLAASLGPAGALHKIRRKRICGECMCVCVLWVVHILWGRARDDYWHAREGGRELSLLISVCEKCVFVVWGIQERLACCDSAGE